MSDDDQETPESGYLPPIGRVRLPDMLYDSTKIRWLLGVGYKVKEIAPFLGLRYQQVRNVSVTEPKRAAREDVPPLVVEVLELDGDLESMDRHAMEREMMAQRGEGVGKRGNRGVKAEDLPGNEDLDDEDYGRS